MSMPPEAKAAVLHAMNCARRENFAGIAEAINVIASYGVGAVYTCCWGWAFVAGMLMYPPKGGPNETATFDVRDVVGPGGNPDNPSTSDRRAIWAMRFITTVHNGDPDTTDALFRAVPRGQLTEHIAALLHRLVLAERALKDDYGTPLDGWML